MLSAVCLENPWSQNKWPEEDLIKASLKRAMCFEVFVDEGLEEEVQPNDPKLMNPNSPRKQTETKSQEPFVGAFKIWTEDDDDGDEDDCSYGDNMEIKEHTGKGSNHHPLVWILEVMLKPMPIVQKMLG